MHSIGSVEGFVVGDDSGNAVIVGRVVNVSALVSMPPPLLVDADTNAVVGFKDDEDEDDDDKECTNCGERG